MNVLMPQLGETVPDGKVTKWFKAVGDLVAAGDNLCEIETDKVTVEVPATSAGILSAIHVDAGTVAKVGAVIAEIGGQVQPAAAIPALRPAIVARDPFQEVQTPKRNFGPARLANGVSVTPLARRLAATGAIDLAGLKGSGAQGRITSRDIEQAIAAGPAVRAQVSGSADLVSEAHRSRPHRVLPVDGMRRTIAKRLVESKTTIPHFYLTADIGLDRLLRIREEINAEALKGAGGVPAYKLSINDFMIRALALALLDVPAANVIWAGDNILSFQHADIGVAVAISGGLLTPVITGAEAKSLTVISAEMKSLAARARERALQPHEYQGGATSISNLGMHGIREFCAIINPPQSTILAIGASRREAVETGQGGVAFVSRMSVTLSCDHRAVDGAVGADLLGHFRDYAEHPLRLMV